MDISNLKPSDIVICIDDSVIVSNEPLTRGKKYEVINSGRAQSGFETYNDYIIVYNDDGNSYSYLAERFISLEDWREKKLNNILE